MYHGSYMFNRRCTIRKGNHKGIIRTTLHDNDMQLVYPWVANAYYRSSARIDVAAAEERSLPARERAALGKTKWLGGLHECNGHLADKTHCLFRQPRSSLATFLAG
jgi:hypothetical protein